MRSLALILLIGLPATSQAEPAQAVEQAIDRCAAWMTTLDDATLSSGWVQSHALVVPGADGAAGEVTHEFHHPNFAVVIQSSHRPASGNRSCSVIAAATAFNTLEATPLETVPPARAIGAIEGWMDRAVEAGQAQSTAPEALV